LPEKASLLMDRSVSELRSSIVQQDRDRGSSSETTSDPAKPLLDRSYKVW